jgi:PPOX class probable F420-dependent enzyme
VKEAAVPGMSEQEIWDFLTEGTRTAHVATTRSDGRPHVKPVWFVLDGRPGGFQFLFTTYAESVTGRGLRRNAPVAVSVDDPAPPYSFVIIEGIAHLSDRLEDVRAAATRIGGRYMGEDRAAEFGARNGVPGELLIRLTPARITAQRAVSG